MKKLTIDFETRSAAPIKQVGAAAYAQDQTTEVICLALKWHGEEPVVWLGPGFRFPELVSSGRFRVVDDADLREMMRSADVIEAHNAQFEYFIWKYVMPRYGIAMFDAAKLRCSAAKAAMYSLPRDLAGACAVARVRQQKDADGHRLMLKLCKPRRPRREEMLRDPDWENRLYWYDNPAEFERLILYCTQDVRAEEALSDALPELPEREQSLWQLDLAINDRGVRIDAPAVRAILDGVARHSADMKREFQRMTGLESPTQRNATLRHLLALGVQMDGLTRSDVESALNSTDNETAKRILQIRQSLSKSSTAKYQAFLNAAGPDDRIRGCFMYHGAGTGRWSGRLIQPQNFPRGAFHDVEPCIRFFKAGDLEDVKLFYGDPMEAASTCIRSMIVPAPGNDFICADYSSIEGRVLAWIAGEESALDVYREGGDPYKVAASAIYHVPYDKVDKGQRQVGKVAELACIAEGSMVLTDQGLVPIEQVKPFHRLWDGIEWVSHDGVVCRGEKEVMEYGGLVATPDHEVWVEGKQGPVPFGIAAACGARLVQTGDGRRPVRLGSDYFAGETVERKVAGVLCADGVCRLWEEGMDQSGGSHPGKIKGVSRVLSAETDSFMAGETVDGGETALRKSGGPRIQELWRKRNHIRVSFRTGSRSLDSAKRAWCLPRKGDRPDRQQQGILSGKHTLRHTYGEQHEPTEHGYPGVESVRVAVLERCCFSQVESRFVEKTDSSGRKSRSSGETEELARDRGTARVYDILNAGPRHRFTVSGVLVHNCGYQGSVGAFNQMALGYGVELPETEVRDIVEKWRNSRPMTVRLWHELDNACKAAISNPGHVYSYRGIKFVIRGRYNRMLAVMLPSGRCLWYVDPRLAQEKMAWGEEKTVIHFDGVNSATRKWGTQKLYGGLLAENVTQAVARDVLVNGMFTAEAAGYPIVLHVHDEAVSEVPEGFGSVEEYENLLCAVPQWAAGLPLKAEGWRGKRYRK